VNTLYVKRSLCRGNPWIQLSNDIYTFHRKGQQHS